jgi:acylphosphatase
MRGVRVVIEGRVQGVFYRDWTRQTAQSLGLSGWVCNRRDGTVEAAFAGTEAAVSRMLDLCREGPPSARVSDVRVVAEDEAADEGFAILPTV